VNDEESGGVQGLRAWVLAATKRALRLYPHMGATADLDAYEESVAELSELIRLLDHDAELRATVTVRLGTVLAMRHLTGGGAPEDRERAQRLLREARDPGTPTGAATDADDRRWAALSLLSLVWPMPQGLGGIGQPSSFSAFIDPSKLRPGEIAAAAAEIPGLAAEALELPLPPEMRGALRQMSTMFAALSGPGGPGALRQFVDSLPDGFPHVDQMRLLTGVLSTAAGPQPGQAPDDADTIAADAMTPALFDALEAVRSSDPEALNRALRRLRAAHERLPPGHEASAEIQNVIGLLLQGGRSVGGNLQDGSLGHAYATALAERMASSAATSTTPVAAEYSVMVRVYPLMSDVDAAYRAEDTTALRTLLGELETLAADTPQDNWARFQILLALAQACLSLGRLTKDGDMLLRGADYHEQGLAAAEDAPSIFRERLSEVATGPDAVRARVREDPDLLRGATAAPPDASTGQRWNAALSLMTRYGLTGDLADLDPVISELRRICDDIRRGQRPDFAARAQWMLAEGHQARWQHTRDPADQAAATATAKEALNALAADVLLQVGAEHGLVTARAGAARALMAATWAASRHQAEEAVAALELGRAMVLRAASASRSVPELLEARGHQELAEAWRSDASREAPADDGPPGELPSTLRSRALEALGYRQQGLFTTPTLHELADGVAESGADALVYLLLGEGETPGVGIVVGPDSVGVGSSTPRTPRA
jgi:hypothetical protein